MLNTSTLPGAVGWVMLHDISTLIKQDLLICIPSDDIVHKLDKGRLLNVCSRLRLTIQLLAPDRG